jgi:dihydroflavonol-4-reductase
MNVVVTGGTGFVGSHVVDELLRRNHNVICIARSTSNLRWLNHKPITIVDGSLTNQHSLNTAFEQADAVIHVAGLTAARNEEEFMQGNKVGTENVLRSALTRANSLKRFVHVSSLAAVGPAQSKNTPITEETPYHPITAYGRSKKAAEDVVLRAKDKLPITIVRPPAVYGERDEAILSFFQTVNKRIAPLIGFSEKWISLVHVTDLANGIVSAMESPNTIGKSYFVSSDEFYTWKQISELTATILGKKALTINLPHSLVMTIAGISGFFGRFSSKPPVLNYEKGLDIIQDFWICSTESAKKDFGYKQRVSLADGIKRTTDWYKQEGWL